MRSAKEKLVETKILERLTKYPCCKELIEFLFADDELHEMQDYANNVSIKRLGFNDHGPVHMRQVANNAVKMLEILHEAGIQTSLEKEETGTFEDSLCAVILAGMTHDLGMMIGRQNHEEMSVTFAIPVIEKALKEVFKGDIHKQVVIKSLAIEAVIGHMTQRKIHSLEAGIILVADGCDMTKGRARIPL
ncbi:MAG: phosphohydrolase, partial [bacterium]|nr:phosphohydrolase [bacterium]